MFKDAVSDEGFVYYGLSLDFDTKGRGFYFNSGEKKNHLKWQFSEEGNQCALSPSEIMPVHMHYSLNFQ